VTAAAAAAALKATDGDGGREFVFSVVDELEGHADNAAAAVYGGMVAATSEGIQRLYLHESLKPIVAIPNNHLRTADARAALSSDVPRASAARSLARLAFLIEGLRSANAEVLSHASGDELHEEPRAHLSPVTGQLMEAAQRAGAVHVCWSGAGPTALAFATSDTAGRVIGAMSDVLGLTGEVLALEVDHDGLK